MKLINATKTNEYSNKINDAYIKPLNCYNVLFNLRTKTHANKRTKIARKYNHNDNSMKSSQSI